MQEISQEQIMKILEGVMDPEVPVLSVLDLGVIRDVKIRKSGVEIDISPTYTGCPAMDVISSSVKNAILSIGVNNVKVNTVLTPPWTTDWISEAGRKKLEDFGIAPPQQNSKIKRELFEAAQKVPCPKCKASDTSCVSLFGSTACKALYKCNVCLEPFDYFKCL
tara:strand:- start:216 stop:707 length:492 start_codon:yes stop_codon:yes gene_type:complete